MSAWLFNSLDVNDTLQMIYQKLSELHEKVD
jgi:hypothetical protein